MKNNIHKLIIKNNIDTLFIIKGLHYWVSNFNNRSLKLLLIAFVRSFLYLTNWMI